MKGAGMVRRTGMAAVALVVLAGAVPASAVPAFERRYGVACSFCHDGYPKLNLRGQRFKERGFRMEREDPFVLKQWARAVPLTARLMVNRFLFPGDDETSVFLKPLSAGHLGQRLSYWVDEGVIWSDRNDDFTHTRVDNGWARLEVVRGGRLYARAGRIELDLPFTQARTPHLFPYEVYFVNPGFESDAIGDYQDGLEVGGELPGDARWSAAVVAGRDPHGSEELDEDTDKFDGNLFLRASKRLSVHRVGAFAYIARNTLARSPAIVWTDNYVRLGADASVWVRRLNLYGVILYGRNDDPVATAERPRGTGQSESFNGGFLQGDYHWGEWLVVSLRLDAVSRAPALSSRLPPAAVPPPRQTFTGVFPGLQLFPRERLKLSFEYGWLNRARSDVAALRAEVAF
jgi:hypothetical protein